MTYYCFSLITADFLQLKLHTTYNHTLLKVLGYCSRVTWNYFYSLLAIDPSIGLTLQYLQFYNGRSHHHWKWKYEMMQLLFICFECFWTCLKRKLSPRKIAVSFVRDGYKLRWRLAQFCSSQQLRHFDWFSACTPLLYLLWRGGLMLTITEFGVDQPCDGCWRWW